MLRRDRGQAALFDALIFLSIVAVVSASLLSAASSQGREGSSAEQERVVQAQAVLLRTTVEVDGRNVTMLDLALSVVQGAQERERALVAEVRAVLDDLLPGMGYRWSIHGRSSIEVSTGPEGDGDRFCTAQSLPMADGTVSITLLAWKTY